MPISIRRYDRARSRRSALIRQGAMPALRSTHAAVVVTMLLVVTPGRGASEHPDLGAIEGTVRVSVAGEAAPAMLSPYARRRYRPPTPSAPNPGSPTNTIAYVLPATSDGDPPAPSEATIEQRNR